MLILGRALSKFVRAVGIYDDSGTMRRRLWGQMERLFRARIDPVDERVQEFLPSLDADDDLSVDDSLFLSVLDVWAWPLSGWSLTPGWPSSGGDWKRRDIPKSKSLERERRGSLVPRYPPVENQRFPTG